MLYLPVLLAAIAAADLVPMRWGSSDPASLSFLKNTPVNCVLLEKQPTAEFLQAGKASQITVYGVVRPGEKPMGNVDGLVFEGDHPDGAVPAGAISLPSRARMRFDARPVVGTVQGVWPGIHAEDEANAKAAPSGAPWIHTNGGFLRFVKAAAADAPVWIGQRPPANQVLKAEHYLQAIADSAIVGVRWIVALDADLEKRLLAGDSKALADWKRIVQLLAFYETNKQWRTMPPLGRLALVQDVDSGALFSGGVLDMIAVKHTPVLPIPSRQLAPGAMKEAQMVVNVAPASLTPEQRSVLREVTSRGGSMLSGPPGWKFPQVTPEQITLGDNEVKLLDDIWKETNSMTGRRNLGARLFNVSSMLSNLQQRPGTKEAVLHLVNYSGYPVENVTVHMLGKYAAATLVTPAGVSKKLELYDVEEGSAFDIDAIGTVAAIQLTRQ